MSTFTGFAVPQKNYFHMPNEWINICAHIDNLAELKIVQYVLRHTWGYHEYDITKTISVDEFMYGRKRSDDTRIDEGTGLKSDRSVKDGIKAAVEHKYIICEVDTSDKGRIKKSYKLNMAEPGGYNLPPQENKGEVDTTPLEGSIYPSEVQHLPLRGTTSTPRTEKDTIEKHYKKNTRGKKEAAKATQPPTAPAKEEKEKIVLSPEQQAVFDEWCKMPWFKGVIPTLGKNDQEYLRKIAGYHPTAEKMLGCRNWAMSKAVDTKGWYRRTGWTLYGLSMELPKWLSLAPDEPGEGESPPTGSTPRSALPASPGGNSTNLVALAAAQRAQRQAAAGAGGKAS